MSFYLLNSSHGVSGRNDVKHMFIIIQYYFQYNNIKCFDFVKNAFDYCHQSMTILIGLEHNTCNAVLIADVFWEVLNLFREDMSSSEAHHLVPCRSQS